MKPKSLIQEIILNSKEISRFRKEVYAYFTKDGRDLPWRKTQDPYHILVSEIMLQQTQVDRVVDKYKIFINAFPSFKALNQATLADVYKQWQGLGYNRRALSLKKISKIIEEDYSGKLPSHEEHLRSLPGIGKATAASIQAFGFNLPSLFIETNIRTVFIHHFFKNKTMVSDAEILPVLTQTLDIKFPRKWYSALMDYGTMLKKTTVNPSRKSKHYAKQSPFKGSRREIRGTLLKLLLEKSSLNKNQILKCFIDKEPAIINEILEEMCKEEMLNENGGSYKIS